MTEVCLALCAGTDVPDPVRAVLPELPETMSGSDALAGKVTRACIELTEATVLAPHVGESFEATVLRAANGRRDAEVFVPDATVIAPCAGEPKEGSRIRIRLTHADPRARKVRFAYPA